MNVFEECLKCNNDFSYFTENYVKINHPKRGLVSFPLYDFQKRLIKDYNENRFVAVKKFRCGGFSTVTALYGLWQCLFHTDSRFLFICKTDREAINLGKIVNTTIRNLPEQFRPFLTQNSDHCKKFQCTGSEMHFLTPVAACSKAVTHLVIDEAAFIPNMDEHWQAMFPTIATGGKCFAVSTVNGIGNWFYDVYNDAVERKNDFKPFDCSYTEHPDYNNAAWVEETKKNLGERGWLQEMECCFVGSEPTKLDKLRWTLGKIINNHKITEKNMIKSITCEIFDHLEKE